MLLALAATANNVRGPRYAEQVFGAIHQADTHRQGFQLEYGKHNGTAGLFVRCCKDIAAVIESQFAAQYPHVRQARIAKDALDPSAGYEAWYAHLHLNPDVFPIRRHVQFEDQLERNVSDPLATLLTAVAGDSSDTRCRITIDVRPARRHRRYLAQRSLNQLSTPFFRRHFLLFELYVHLARSRWLLPRLVCWPLLWLFRSDGSRGGERASRMHDREDAIDAGIDKVGRHLFDVRIRLVVFARPGAAAAARTRLRELAGAFGHFTSNPEAVQNPVQLVQKAVQQAVAPIRTEQQKSTQRELVRLRARG